MSIIYFDLETGGLRDDQPDIQLAAVAVAPDGREMEVFQRRIQFDEAKADPEALKINHYDADLWAKEAVPEAQALAEFSAFMNRYRSIEMVSKRTGQPYSVARLAGYNAATFDGPRLKRMFERHRAFMPAHPQTLCVYQRAIWWFLERGLSLNNMKLGTVCGHFGIALPDAHDALADVKATAKLADCLRAKELAAA